MQKSKIGVTAKSGNSHQNSEKLLHLDDLRQIEEMFGKIEKSIAIEKSPLMYRELYDGLEELVNDLTEFRAFTRRSNLKILTHMIELTALEAFQKMQAIKINQEMKSEKK